MTPKLAPRERCTGCSSCLDACHSNALSMHRDYEGFLYPKVDTVRCVECGGCTRSCPVLTPPKIISDEVTCHAARCRDNMVRVESSSGGIFPILAADCLTRGGSVYGCRYDDAHMARHVRITNQVELKALYGSKYLQSETTGIFRLVKTDLKANRPVLFSGTPCQVGALNSFLGHDEPNLLTMEVICHGVPSPAVWQKYLEELKRNIPSSKSWKISARDKFVSWRKFSMTVCSENYIHREIFSQNIFMKIFLKNLSLRPSCFQCCFRQGASGADITLGDFWGIERLQSSLDDDRGVSAVILHTQKAREIWQSIASVILCEPCELADITLENPCYLTSVKYPQKRDYFMQHFKEQDWDKLYARCIAIPWPIRSIQKIYHFIRGK